MNQNYSIKYFLPLFFLSISIGISIWIEKMDVWNTTTFMCDFMGIFFVIFGGFKLYDLRAFVETYSTYDLIAQHSKAYAYLYPFIEITLGVLYLLQVQLMLTNALTMVIMLIGAAGVARALLKKKPVQCACLGTAFKIPMTSITLFEDLIMAAMAAAMLFLKL